MTTTADTPPPPSFYLSLDQVRDSGLLTPARLAAVEAEIERRISVPQDTEGRPIESARLADCSPWPRMLYTRLDHESGWNYMRRELLAIVLTEEERQFLDKHALSAASQRRDEAAFTKAVHVAAADWDGWVCDGDSYYENVEDYLDRWVSDQEEGGPIEAVLVGLPRYLRAAIPESVIQELDVARVVERQLDERGWEDCSTDDLEGVADLQAALDRFVEANAAIISHRMDRKTAILLGDDVKEQVALDLARAVSDSVYGNIPHSQR